MPLLESDVATLAAPVRTISTGPDRMQPAVQESTPTIRATAPRPAWIEVDLRALRHNYAAIHHHKRAAVKILAVVKDEAYGHGGYRVAKAVLECGASALALSTIEEALDLQQKGIRARMLMMGERAPDELKWCVAHGLVCSVGNKETAALLAAAADRAGARASVHLKINTGLNRFGVAWDQAAELAACIARSPALRLEGAYSHFAGSDEADKSFALVQLARFQKAVGDIEARGIPVPTKHICNSGGFLDLPQAHMDMVRIGLLQHGVYPSDACSRIPGVTPVMTVKARVTAIQKLSPGDSVGYGMHFHAETPRTIAVLPIGYGDGFPRVRNAGEALLAGKRAPIVGSVAMDALTVDITHIPEVRLWDEAVVLGSQGEETITAHEIAALKNTISYDVLTGWKARLPRVYLDY